MIENANLLLKVEEILKNNNIGRVEFLPINAETINMKLADIQTYYSMEHAQITPYYADKEKKVYDIFACCWKASDRTVGQFGAFSLMYALSDSFRTINVYSEYKDLLSAMNISEGVIEELKQKEKDAASTLADVIPTDKILYTIEQLRAISSEDEIYKLIDELGISIPNEEPGNKLFQAEQKKLIN